MPVLRGNGVGLEQSDRLGPRRGEDGDGLKDSETTHSLYLDHRGLDCRTMTLKRNRPAFAKIV